ncbi:MAG: YihY/virulence factor BrkB family protein, partial [Spirochaetales bacterium]|nr:YihY/virulence factor BrkB family protein [Spirochaetales bacterium]
MKTRAFFSKIGEFLIRLFRAFNRDQCALRASGLAFASLIALVPLSALLISLFSSLGSFSELVESIQRFLVSVLVPTSQEEVLTYINQFIDNTRGLGVFGLLVFLITAILLLAAIQRTFDAVWGTSSRKNPFRKAATYTSILIVGSFILSIGLNITGILSASFSALLPESASWLIEDLLAIFPLIFLFAVLFFMIRFIPVGPVTTRSALIGALVGASLWEVTRIIFVYYATSVIRLNVIYGSLSIVPIFLIWLYLAWMIVLFSLEVTYVHQHRNHRGGGRAVWELEPAELLHYGLELYLTIAGKFAKGEKPPSAPYLAVELDLSGSDITYLLNKFAAAHLLVSAGEKRPGYMPSRALDSISAEQVARCVFGSPAGWEPGASPAIPLYRSMVDAALESIKGRSIRDILGADQEN